VCGCQASQVYRIYDSEIGTIVIMLYPRMHIAHLEISLFLFLTLKIGSYKTFLTYEKRLFFICILLTLVREQF